MPFFRTLARTMTALLFLGAGSAFAASAPSVTAVTKVFGDGQFVSAVVLEYSGTLDGSRLKTTDFAVDGATVSKVYTNTAAAQASQGVPGPFVVVELAHTVKAPVMGPPPGGSPGTNAGPPAGGGPQLGDLAQPGPAPVPLSASVTQKSALTGASGTVFPAGGPWKSSKTVNLVVDDFVQAVYTDPKYPSQPLMYNLYVPKNYDPAKKYPLVLFMHDAGVVSLNPTRTLTQGNGATSFASPAAQARNESFVLAPQYDRVIVGDSSKATDQLDITVDLVKSLVARYSIDARRLYNTGQSMGGMTSIAMDIKYPDLFAASLLVACQWDPALVAPMAKKPLWIVVSEGDTKAKPGEDAILAALKPLGATVTQATWSAEAPTAEVERQANALADAPTSIRYTVYQGGSHTYTWVYAYGTDAMREWLFAQGNPRAFTDKGLRYLNGDGVPASAAQALALFEKGAAAGDMKAPRWAGILSLKGAAGVAPDPAKAAAFFRLAADRGDVTAYYYLGYLAENGITVPQDYAQAAQSYARAAPATGHAEAIACFALGRLYENGLGVTKDLVQAAAWYKRGAALGDADSAAALQRLGAD